MIADTDIQRFIHAQENIYNQVIEELKEGKKRTHWMWFIFPQITGLGSSDTAKYYSIKSVKEAKDYLAHEILSKRLNECCSLLLSVENKTAHEIFSSPDDLKFLSSLTLFQYISPETKIYSDLLKKYFNNKKDEKTVSILTVMSSKSM